MVVFYILIFVPMMLQHLVIGRKNINYQKKNRLSLLIFFVLLAILLSLRHQSVGSDTLIYSNAFKRLADMGWGLNVNETMEFGFLYYNKIVALISKNPQFFFTVTAVITCALIYSTYKRACEDASLTIVLFIIMSTFVMMFSGIRQMLAVALGFVAYEFTRNKKLVLFILTVCLAMTFHVSAFMIVFMYPLYYAKITKKWLIVVMPAIGLIYVFNEPIFFLLIRLISRYTKYESSVTSTGAYTMLILFTLFAIFSFLVPDDTKLDEETVGLRNFLLLSIAIQMFASLHVLAMRMNYYYIIFIPLLLPRIIRAADDRWKQFAVIGRYIMVGFFLLYFFAIKANDAGNLHTFPYRFFWEAV